MPSSFNRCSALVTTALLPGADCAETAPARIEASKSCLAAAMLPRFVARLTGLLVRDARNVTGGGEAELLDVRIG